MEKNTMKLYERDLPGEFSLEKNFTNSAYKKFLDNLDPELLSIFKDDDYYGYGTWFYEKALNFYNENKGEMDWENLDTFVKDFLETEGASVIQGLNNIKKKNDNEREARRTGKVNGKKVWHWEYEDDPDDGTRRSYKADGVDPVNGTYDGVYESIQILKQQGYRVVLNESIINETVDIADEVRELLENDGYDENEIEELMDYTAIDDMAADGSNAREIADKLIDNVYGNLKFESKMNESVKDEIENKIYELAEEFGHGVSEQGNGYLIYNNNIAVEDDDEFKDKLEEELGSTISYDDDGNGNLFVWIENIVESTQMNEAINNPDEPASKKQLWALFCITKQDWRDKNLTKGEASELIQKYSGERPQKSAVTAKSLDSKIKEDIMNNLKPKLDKQMAKAFGLQSVVGDADLEGNLIPGGKRYKFFGSGCGWAWVKYDKRNKKLGEILEKYDDIYRHGYFEKFANEYIKKYKERELGAVLSQDIDIQCIIKQAALDFAESIGINVKGAYVNSRLD
jgi:hypothetical protein